MNLYQDVLTKGFDEFARYINPLIANRARLSGEPVHFVRASQGQLIDVQDQVYEDFHGTQMLGHRNPVVTQALQEFLKSDVPNWFPSRVNPWAGRLASVLCERTSYSNVFFGMSGADAVEAALKLARAATKKPRIIGLEGGYHGCTFGAVSLMHEGALRDPFGPHLPGAQKIPFGDVEALRNALRGEDVCAVVVEPIQGEGGVRELPDNFVDALCDLTQKHQALLVADEVQTSLGRSGNFLWSSKWPRKPDVALIAKTLGGGLMPISAMLTDTEIFERAYGANFYSGEAHNTTFGYNALSCVAALATLDLLTDDLVESVRIRGQRFRSELTEALTGNPLFETAMGHGFMMGIQLRQPTHPWLSFDHFGWTELKDQPTIGPLLCHRLYRHGFFAFVCGHNWSILRLQPRFDIPDSVWSKFVDACKQELTALASMD